MLLDSTVSDGAATEPDRQSGTLQNLTMGVATSVSAVRLSEREYLQQWSVSQPAVTEAEHRPGVRTAECQPEFG